MAILLKAPRVFASYGWSEMLLVLWGKQIRDWVEKYTAESYARGYKDGFDAHIRARMEIENRFTRPEDFLH